MGPTASHSGVTSTPANTFGGWGISGLLGEADTSPTHDNEDGGVRPRWGISQLRRRRAPGSSAIIAPHANSPWRSDAGVGGHAAALRRLRILRRQDGGGLTL